MKICFGVDGGQTGTQTVLGDENGRILARVHGGPIDHIDEAIYSGRRAETIASLLRDAMVDASLPPQTRLAALVAGVSGYDATYDDAAPLDIASDRIRLLHDAPIALAGAFAGAPGVVVIVGTGAVAYGENERGERATFGGWGPVFGDEGSAYWIAVRALGGAMQDADRNRRTAVSTAAEQFFGTTSLRAVQRAVDERTLTRPRIAAFARVISDLAHAGDSEANGHLDAAAHEIARLALATAEHLGTPRVALVGGVAQVLASRVAPLLERARPRLALVPARYDPAAGALLLAYRDAGINVGEIR